MSVGVVDRLSDCFAAILVPIVVPELEQLVIGGINLLIAATGYLHCRVVHVFGDPPEDTTQLLMALRQTELGSKISAFVRPHHIPAHRPQVSLPFSMASSCTMVPQGTLLYRQLSPSIP